MLDKFVYCLYLLVAADTNVYEHNQSILIFFIWFYSVTNKTKCKQLLLIGYICKHMLC
jgi:hypothetical protein